MRLEPELVRHLAMSHSKEMLQGPYSQLFIFFITLNGPIKLE